MKKAKDSVVVKIILVILIIICSVVLVTSVFSVLYMKKQGIYDNDKEALIAEKHEEMANEMLNGPLMEYVKQKLGIEGEYEKSIKEYEEFFAPENSNFLFRVFTSGGKNILGTYNHQGYRQKIETEYVAERYKEPAEKIIEFYTTEQLVCFAPKLVYDDGFISESYGIEKNNSGRWQAEVQGYYMKNGRLIISGYVRNTLVVKDDFYKYENSINRLYVIKGVVPYLIISSIAVLIVSLVLIIMRAGHRKESEKIYFGVFDRIPLDILAALLITAPIIMFVVEGRVNFAYYDIVIYILAILFLLYAIRLFVSLAVRIKKGDWWRNTVIYKAFRFVAKITPDEIKNTVKKAVAVVAPWVNKALNIVGCMLKAVRGFVCKIGQILKSIINIIVRLIRKVPLFWKVGLAYAVLAVAELVCILLTFDKQGIFLVIWAVEKLIFALIVMLIVFNLRALQKGGEQLAAGRLEHKIDLKYMFWDFKKHGENLNNINIGMKNAVEEQMKSERLKTELITNVSHDIKTPLTSIISYVDLLKREDVQPDTANQYIEVIDRQSAKLKKLIADLMEVSKASTGNVEVKLEELDVNVLLSQTLGDYVERLEESKITLVTAYDSDSTMATADGQLLWRVFDNLMNNICKYTQEGTRVYINIKSLGDEVKIIFKNISRFELNISADELMERFVRGDGSRNTEGSGLGLSIAENFMQLQGGGLNLYIDGDLFKAEVTLKRVVE